MKKLFFSLVLVALYATCYPSTKPGSVPESKFPINSSEVYVPVGKTGNLISLIELSHISVRDFEKLSGNKMKLGEKVKFKLGQRELRKNINEDGSFNSKKFENYFAAQGVAKAGINLGGFALGLLLSLIGVLIAYVVAGDSKQFIKWTWIGAVISVIVWGAILL